MNQKKYALDFETYVSENSEQSETWVWSSAGAEINGNDVFIHHSISETYEYLINQRIHIKGYYHNLKFDGSFWLDFLIKDFNLELAHDGVHWIPNKDMPLNSYKYLISDMGQWYSITIKSKYGKIIEFVDSLKLIPFSLAEAGNAFQTEHRKLNMEYKGYRDKEYVLSRDEEEYIINDVLCLKECIEYMMLQGHTSNTIGSCCMHEYKNKFMSPFDKKEFQDLFPELYEMDLPSYIHANDITSAGEYIRKGYRGGWCHLKRGCDNKIFEKGTTFDVNSLYPSVMHSMSGNCYPIGEPHFWCGNYIPEVAQQEDKYYFVRFQARFKLKDNHLPTVQIKNNPCYKGTEYLYSSDLHLEDKYYRFYSIGDNLIECKPELTMTCVDFKLFQEHYYIYDLEILDGCWFYTYIGLFDKYIDHFAETKKNNKGALRTLAKLFLNNLYGQFAKSNDSSYKLAYLEDGIVKFVTVPEFEKQSGYIPIGAAITSYAREFTIRTAQKNYDNFIYADTDSIHMLNGDNAINIPLHDVDFCMWKRESDWERAIFIRQKTYIEITNGKWDIKCAGMTKKCKQIYQDMVCLGDKTLTDFKVGLEIPTGKLRPKKVKGGTILVDTSYKLR